MPINKTGLTMSTIHETRPTQSQGLPERPYMVFVYTYKFKVEGQGTYEVQVTNLVNPYTMKAISLTPGLVNPL